MARALRVRWIARTNPSLFRVIVPSVFGDSFGLKDVLFFIEKREGYNRPVIVATPLSTIARYPTGRGPEKSDRRRQGQRQAGSG